MEMKGKFTMTIDKSNSQYPETGSKDYRAFVDSYTFYDIVGAEQFNLLTTKNLKADHKLLDIGCGSLRGGKLFIPYLKMGQCCAIEQEKWLLDFFLVYFQWVNECWKISRTTN